MCNCFTRTIKAVLIVFAPISSYEVAHANPIIAIICLLLPKLTSISPEPLYCGNEFISFSSVFHRFSGCSHFLIRRNKNAIINKWCHSYSDCKLVKVGIKWNGMNHHHLTWFNVFYLLSTSFRCSFTFSHLQLPLLLWFIHHKTCQQPQNKASQKQFWFKQLLFRVNFRSSNVDFWIWMQEETRNSLKTDH